MNYELDKLYEIVVPEETLCVSAFLDQALMQMYAFGWKKLLNFVEQNKLDNFLSLDSRAKLVEFGINEDLYTEAILSRIYNDSLAAGTYFFKITENLDWREGAFGDENSCFWHSNAAARDVFKFNKVKALQFFDKDGVGLGRCWFYEFHDLWIIFNAYGQLYLEEVMYESSWTSKGRQDAKIGRIGTLLAFAFQRFTKHIALSCSNRTDGLVYINTSDVSGIGKGVVISATPQFYMDKFDLGLDESCISRCDECRRIVMEAELMSLPIGDHVCISCYSQHKRTCGKCSKQIIHNARVGIPSDWLFVDETMYCSKTCASRDDVRQCSRCYKWNRCKNMVYVNKKWNCAKCFTLNFQTNIVTCPGCRQLIPCGDQVIVDMLNGESKIVCSTCKANYIEIGKFTKKEKSEDE